MPRFRSIRTKLLVLYGALFGAAVLIVAIAAQAVIVASARRSVSAELVTSGIVYDRLWAMREQALIDSAGVVVRDFGFRSAVASGDRPTIASALATLRARAGVDQAMMVDTDGVVTGGDGSLDTLAGTLPYRLPAGGRDAVLVSGGRVYRFVVTPVLAPVEIGWVVFAIRLDQAELRSLERLSAIPLTATVLRRDGDGHWSGMAGHLRASAALDRLVGRPARDHRPEALELPGGRALSLAKPLAAADGTAEAAILLSYPDRLALAPYRPLQAGLLLAGLLGLLLVLFGSARLARGIASPISALDAAARALRAGARTELVPHGSDEIARLAESFNHMSAEIIDREHRISHLAFHDLLTELPNRTYFRQVLEETLARTGRTGEQVVVFCLDLDGFKGVNDTLGHPVGDALLRVIATMLVELVPGGTVSRLGGDEFAIILPNEGVPDQARAVSQQIVDALREPIEVDGHTVATGASIGIAVGPGDGTDPDILLKNADLALYRAKQDGRSTFRFFEPALDAAARRRRELELDLRTALRMGQFRLDFQPVIDLKNDRIGGFEALLRWHHPRRGLVSPATFIPVAEETGMIVAIGEWVLHEACRVAVRWPPHVRVAVNVSPLQFRSSGFASMIVQALAHSGLAPERLEIEITESVFLDGADTVVALLHQLRSLGIRIALDDFGTGYSSLSYLRRFPFDKIKIDRSFISSLGSDPSAAAIVRAIVELATALDMETTAEGVEDQQQLDQLRARGCGNIQGFLFSRPVDAPHAAAMLAARSSAAA